jgi:hypothetical protein
MNQSVRSVMGRCAYPRSCEDKVILCHSSFSNRNTKGVATHRLREMGACVYALLATGLARMQVSTDLCRSCVRVSESELRILFYDCLIKARAGRTRFLYITRTAVLCILLWQLVSFTTFFIPKVTNVIENMKKGCGDVRSLHKPLFVL